MDIGIITVKYLTLHISLNGQSESNIILSFGGSGILILIWIATSEMNQVICGFCVYYKRNLFMRNLPINWITKEYYKITLNLLTMNGMTTYLANKLISRDGESKLHR